MESVSLTLKGPFPHRRERLLGPECLAFALTTFSNVHDTSLKLLSHMCIKQSIINLHEPGP